MGTIATFTAPPVVESVISAQFLPLRSLTSFEAVQYWKECLGDAWPTSSDAPLVDDRTEPFGPAMLVAQGPVLREVPSFIRTQFIRNDNARMIQVQPSRFIYNWRRQSEEYPTFDVLEPEFFERLDQFAAHISTRGVGRLALNQWEVTYVNHFPKGDLWDSPSDWQTVIPGLIGGFVGREGVELEGGEINLRYLISDSCGRVHASVKHARMLSNPTIEVLSLELTARGPASNNEELRAGVRRGHDAIVHTFVATTSSIAQSQWGRQF